MPKQTPGPRSLILSQVRHLAFCLVTRDTAQGSCCGYGRTNDRIQFFQCQVHIVYKLVKDLCNVAEFCPGLSSQLHSRHLCLLRRLHDHLRRNLRSVALVVNVPVNVQHFLADFFASYKDLAKCDMAFSVLSLSSHGLWFASVCVRYVFVRLFLPSKILRNSYTWSFRIVFLL